MITQLVRNDKYLDLCVELNDLLYELKIVLPKSHAMQGRIDRAMKEYQKLFLVLAKIK